jgi:hypothetical protein
MQRGKVNRCVRVDIHPRNSRPRDYQRNNRGDNHELTKISECYR